MAPGAGSHHFGRASRLLEPEPRSVIEPGSTTRWDRPRSGSDKVVFRPLGHWISTRSTREASPTPIVSLGSFVDA